MEYKTSLHFRKCSHAWKPAGRHVTVRKVAVGVLQVQYCNVKKELLHYHLPELPDLLKYLQFIVTCYTDCSIFWQQVVSCIFRHN